MLQDVTLQLNSKQTKYTYTGQYSYTSDFGLMLYREASRAVFWRVDNARWYDSSLGRFTQADSIIPAGVQGLDRYAYVNNAPVNLTDPSGHSVDCGIGDSCESLVTQTLKNRYDWTLEGEWSLGELDTIYQIGRDIEEYANGQTGGNGLDWMLGALGSTTIEHWSPGDGHSDATLYWTGPRIRLDQNWTTHQWEGNVVLAHELGHVWDINSGFAHSGEMNSDLDGSSWCYFCSPNGAPKWNPKYHEGYGNNRRNEYFAEAFAATIYPPSDSSYVPSGVSNWIDWQISIDLIDYLVPGAMW